jgi:sec-independent protein translocase protein TatA
MPGFGLVELVIILVIVVALFGAGRLSGVGSAIGKSIRDFRGATEEPVVPVCHNCGQTAATGTRFCGACGNRL